MTDPDTILLETEDSMSKAVEYLARELRGVRTGRASPALVEFVKVDYYGASTDLKALASISVPEPTQLLIKPFDAGAIQEIKKAIEASGLGLNPNVDGKQIRLNIPALSGERRKQLITHCKKLGEETKVNLRNARRDANKTADSLKSPSGKGAGAGGAHVSEDEIKTIHGEIQELLKKYETQVDDMIARKAKEVEEV